jgi:hypothetical protein
LTATYRATIWTPHVFASYVEFRTMSGNFVLALLSERFRNNYST